MFSLYKFFFFFNEAIHFKAEYIHKNFFPNNQYIYIYIEQTLKKTYQKTHKIPSKKLEKKK